MDIRATVTYFPKISPLTLEYSQVPRIIGQMLTTFFPNRAKPDIRPMVTREKPLRGSLEMCRIQAEIKVTMAELISAAPGPAIST